jgi:Ca-activated chloride channel family protein
MTVDFESLRFGNPSLLWLLVVPAALLVLWAIRLARRRADIARLRRQRMFPVRERFTATGDLAFWLAVLAASSLCIVALARPQARVTSFRRANLDVVILQDASASMYVADVRPDRWRRSIQFLRTFSESLSWQGDRVALALFARMAAPQVRLTSDPNALFFFLDHLGDHSPFALENVTTWDTNIEEGIRWGLRLVEADEQVFGRSGNARAFLVVSDGQAWSGTVATALQAARSAGVPVYVIGVGSDAGGMIPEPLRADGTRPPPVVHSRIDRRSLLQIAVAGGGEYFELGQEPDRVVAFRLIERLRRRAPNAQQIEITQELYRPLLVAAAAMVGLGTLVGRQRVELAWQAAGAATGVLVLAAML